MSAKRYADAATTLALIAGMETGTRSDSAKLFLDARKLARETCEALGIEVEDSTNAKLREAVKRSGRL